MGAWAIQGRSVIASSTTPRPSMRPTTHSASFHSPIPTTRPDPSDSTQQNDSERADSGLRRPTAGTHLDHPTHYALSSSVPGPPLLIRNISKGRRRVRGRPTAPPGGRIWHGFAVRRPPVGGAAGNLGADTLCDLAESDPMHSAAQTYYMDRAQCQTRSRSTSSTCFRRSRWRASAGFLAEPSTELSRGASCGRRGCATDSALPRLRSSGGSRSVRSRSSRQLWSAHPVRARCRRRGEAFAPCWPTQEATEPV